MCTVITRGPIQSGGQNLCLYNVLTEEQYIFRVVMRQKEKDFEFLGARSCTYEETNERQELVRKVCYIDSTMD